MKPYASRIGVAHSSRRHGPDRDAEKGHVRQEGRCEVREALRDPETEAEMLRLAGEVAGRTRTPEQAEADLQRLASTLAAFND